MNNPIRILVMHGQPLTREGLQSFIKHDVYLADRLSVVSGSASNFEDGLALYKFEQPAPNLVLMDMNLPLAYNQRASVSPDRIADFQARTRVPIVLLYAPPASLSVAALLMRGGVASGLIETAELHNTAILAKAVERVLAGQSYIYYSRQERKLSDLTPGQKFFSLKDEHVALLELLAEKESPKAMLQALALSPSGVYRRLDELAQEFDVKSWKYLVRHAENMGILREGKVWSPNALRRSDKSNGFFPPQSADGNLAYYS